MKKGRRGGFRYKKGKAAGTGRRQDTVGREQLRWRQLMISGSVFVLLVAMKLLLPERIHQIGDPLSRMLENNMDVMAVFSAVGQALSGSEEGHSTWENVYQAVFGPEGTEIEADESGDAAEASQTASDVRTEKDGTAFVYTDANLPENVQMQQVVLGFDYCAPVRGSISSEFGYRQYPEGQGERFHYGIDLLPDAGKTIAVFADGIVSVVGESSSYGKYLVVAHGADCSTLYAHCASVGVSVGQTVKKGETIAEMGDTGQATGEHLHFELQQGEVYLNPVYYVR